MILDNFIDCALIILGDWSMWSWCSCSVNFCPNFTLFYIPSLAILFSHVVTPQPLLR